MLKVGEYIERILLHALQSLEKCVDHGITDVLCQIQYAVPLQSYKVVSGCDMHGLYLANHVYNHGACSSQCVSYQLVRRNHKQKSNIVLQLFTFHIKQLFTLCYLHPMHGNTC